MSDWLPETPRNLAFPTTAYVTLAGADWLASASPHPRSMHTLWAARPTAPSVLPCGTAFDVINAPALFGRRMVNHLWSTGPGSGPVAAHRGRILLFAAPGTAQRLPALLDWMGAPSARSGGEGRVAVPALLCHGTGDAVTVPPLHPRPAAEGPVAAVDGTATEDTLAPNVSRWLVAPDVRNPWLPGPDVLLWACLRVARAGADGGDEGEGDEKSTENAAQSGLPALIPQ
ncbi:bifunctional DNA primase/polymerase [Streptomyces sp. NPDC017993]|uniref:bifunctional DNA primase/polymerase n=1 Tax=Streptomyces sp. NPDC017993 TaxID=3365027 RepID=UPI00378D2104